MRFLFAAFWVKSDYYSTLTIFPTHHSLLYVLFILRNNYWQFDFECKHLIRSNDSILVWHFLVKCKCCYNFFSSRAVAIFAIQFVFEMVWRKFDIMKTEHTRISLCNTINTFVIFGEQCKRVCRRTNTRTFTLTSDPSRFGLRSLVTVAALDSNTQGKNMCKLFKQFGQFGKYTLSRGVFIVSAVNFTWWEEGKREEKNKHIHMKNHHLFDVYNVNAALFWRRKKLFLLISSFAFIAREEEKMAFGWGSKVGLAMKKIDIMKYKCVNEHKKVSFFKRAPSTIYDTAHTRAQAMCN